MKARISVEIASLVEGASVLGVQFAIVEASGKSSRVVVTVAAARDLADLIMDAVMEIKLDRSAMKKRQEGRPVQIAPSAIAGMIDAAGGDSGCLRVHLGHHEVTDLILSGQAYSLDGKFNIRDDTGRLRALEAVEDAAAQAKKRSP